tara:strand:+ start:626 stop:1177 length:552 start_codon:yes stop_codon:yes gene_type:complete
MPIIFDFTKGKTFFSKKTNSQKILIDIKRAHGRRKDSHTSLNNIFTENMPTNQTLIHEWVPEIVRESYISNDHKIYAKKDRSSSVMELYDKTNELSLENIIEEVKSGNKFLSDGKGSVEFYDFKSGELIYTYFPKGGDNLSWLELDEVGGLKIHTYDLINPITNEKVKDKEKKGKPLYDIKIK